MSKTYLSNAAILLIRKHVKRRGLDLSKEVLWVSVGQRVAKSQAIKDADLKKMLPVGPPQAGSPGLILGQ